MTKIELLNKKIIRCKKCPRLVAYIQNVAKEKVKRFIHEKYWGRPLTGFGDFDARVLIVGLAPAAHGGNRTGRMFRETVQEIGLQKLSLKMALQQNPQVRELMMVSS